VKSHRSGVEYGAGTGLLCHDDNTLSKGQQRLYDCFALLHYRKTYPNARN
jgi:hypothetical protein